MENLGFFGLLHLILVVYAAIQIINSRAGGLAKLIWVLVVAVFPVLGLIVWFFAGPGTPKK